MEIEEWLSFDDVLLLPKYSTIRKSDVDIGWKLGNLKFTIPLVSSPMDTVTEAKLAIELARLGGLGIIHRNLSIANQVAQVKKVKTEKLPVGAAVGVGEDLLPRLEVLVKAGVEVLVLDSAHGHAQFVINRTRMIKAKYPKVALISGNVGNSHGFENLAKAGADAIRVGLGPGSICTTRIVTGVGVPQFSAIADCAKLARKLNIVLIADGGIRSSGDIVKALAAGANSVMLGRIFARTDEAPGKVVIIGGKKYKYYRGMGSVAAMRKGSASRYDQRVDQKRLIAEGVEGLVAYKGKLGDYVFQLLGGVKAGMVYTGAANIKQLWEKAQFIKMSHAGLVESHPHSLKITNAGENYYT